MTTTLTVERLGQVSLLSRDIARTEAFYRDTLGIPHLFTFGDLAFFQVGETRLFVRSVPDGRVARRIDPLSRGPRHPRRPRDAARGVG